MALDLLRRGAQGLLAGILLWTTGAPAQDSGHLTLLTEDLPPYNMLADDGKTVIGWSSEKVASIAKHAGIRYTVEVTSWARAYTSARSDEGTCVYSTARTPERESLFKWIGPLATNEWMLFARTADGKNIANLEAVRGTRIGGYFQSAGATYLESKGFSIIYSKNHEVTVKNLMLERLDYWVASRSAGLALISRLELDGKIAPVLTLKQFELYLACHPGTSNALITKLTDAVKALSGDGTLAQIDARYKDWVPAKAK